MTPLMFALCVMCLLLGRMADTTALQQSPTLHFVSVPAGEDVTLECFYEEDNLAVMFSWYKQTVGQQPQQVSIYYKYKNGSLNDEFKNDPRFEMDAATGKNHLKISSAQISDSATYYCISSNSYKVEFLEGAIIHVHGSGLSIPALVLQSASESIQLGGSVTLNCTVHTGTCDGEHSVYWFKDSEESHPGLIYTHGGRNDQCERKPNTQSHTCVYNLPMNSLNLSHAGTYYCAVASCGHILFGEGTKLDIEHYEYLLVLAVFVLGGALAFATTLVFFVACIAKRMYEKKSCQCTDIGAIAPVASAASAEGYQDADNLHYAAIRKNHANRSNRQRDDTWSVCVYSSVKQ